MAKTKYIQDFHDIEVPENWQVKKLKTIMKEGRLGGNYENAEANTGIPVIKMGNLDRGTIKIDKVQYLPKGESYNNKDVLTDGDLLFNTRNTLELVGKVAVWNNELPFAVYNSNLLRIKFDSTFVESNWFMNYAFNSEYGLRQLKAIATGTTSVAAIYGKDLESIKFLLPPLPEQKVIASMFRIWDKAVRKTEQLIVQKKQRKKWMMQQLFSGKKRLKGFGKANYKKVALDEILTPIRNPLIPEEKTLYQQIGIRSHGKGIFHKELVSGKDLGNKRVFWIEPNCLVINIVFAWEQAIAKTTELEIGMIASHRFPMFKPTEGKLNLDYILYYFKSPRGKQLLVNASPGGAGRNKTLGQNEFINQFISLPTLEEQTAISQVLQAADKEISLLKAKVEKLREQKKGLMQQLLTGRVRLKID
ncbi:restriction endonuclease subunit S [Mucilaginibacter paludis]|uniref:Restriction modification system DNA specificity domain-containing protein n=1 Tax=Mucilaginibacter paludis DSM 18603 TaxID=714943 RepID=H1YB09_9SPHI|nr:restriction endonuclease subunit S [Mucilaginibacter paludis]EHQ30042.1 restriction modification system DNA specificity domain-containing protein [Mucilaginibacter paludis DSM 18603]